MAANESIESIDEHELERFDKLFSIPVALFNEKGIVYLNNSCRQLLGYSQGEPINTDFHTFVDEFDKAVIAELIQECVLSGDSMPKYEVQLITKNKSHLSVEYSSKVVLYHEEKFILATLYDITDKKRIQLDMERISKARELMLEVTQSILKTENIDEMFQLILKNALKALEKGSLGTVLVKKSDFFAVASSIGFAEDVKNFILPYEDAFLYKVTKGKMDTIVNIPDLLIYDKYHAIETKYGEHNFIKSTISAPIYINGSLFGMINIDSVETNAFDELDVKTMEFIRNNIEIALSNHLKYKEKAFLAKYDRLTHLYNRSYFEEQFEIVREKSLRYDEAFSVVMFDINGLKTINDSYGHLVGDKVIQKISSVIERETRKSDLIARLGGDEFVGLFYFTDQDFLIEKFHKMLTRLKNEPLLIDGNQLVCSFSFGISHFPMEGKDLDQLIHLADERMYSFKKGVDTKLFA